MIKKIFSKEVTIGLCVLFALAILIFGVDYLKGAKLFGAANSYYARFDNVTGLMESAPVNINGFKVGTISDMKYDHQHPGMVIVEMSLDRDLRLPVGTTAMMTSDLLGTASISLNLAQSAQMYNMGDTLPSAVEGGLMQTLGDEIVPEFTQLLPKVDSLLVSVNELVSDENIAASLENLNAITSDIRVITGRFSQIVGTLPPVIANVDSLTGNIATITSDVGELTGQLRSLPIDSLVDDLQAVTENLRELSEQLGNPDSSLGRVLNDPALYDNLNSTILSLDSLFLDIKAHPKRYINIKLL